MILIQWLPGFKLSGTLLLQVQCQYVLASARNIEADSLAKRCVKINTRDFGELRF